MAELLRMEDVWSGYGDATVLEGIGLGLDEGDSLALLGRNGMGKTTLLSTLVGAAHQISGSIRFAGLDFAGLTGLHGSSWDSHPGPNGLMGHRGPAARSW